MIENRELSMDDYLAMLRRRAKVVLFPAVLAPLAGFLVSFSFPAKYTSQSVVLIRDQQVPGDYVKPVITEDVMQRVAAIKQKVLSQEQLHSLITAQNLVKRGSTESDVIEQIQQNVTIQPLPSEMTAAAIASGKKKSSDVVGFSVNYTADDPKDAEKVCSKLTDLLLAENRKARKGVAQATTAFLEGQVNSAKRDLDDQDANLAAFKQQHIGQLPGDEENNMKILSGLTSQLEANTQTLNRGQQDKAYAESVLAEQLAAWKATQTVDNPQTLQKQLATLQSQLITLQARYTDDHPDVVKTKNDIAELKRRLNELNSAPPDSDVGDKANLAEPPEIRQLRLQIHQYGEAIAQAAREQKRLQEQVRLFQARVNLIPSVEQQYNQLTRDYKTKQQLYDDLLAKKSQSGMQSEIENESQGEEWDWGQLATLPDSPSFPNRLLFAGGGLGAGLAVGFGIAMWLELRDKSIRTEQDVIAVLDLPMLASVPWVGTEAAQKNGGGHWYGRKAADQEKPETAKV